MQLRPSWNVVHYVKPLRRLLPRKFYSTEISTNFSTLHIIPQRRSFASLQNDASVLSKSPSRSRTSKDDTIYALSTAPSRAAIAIVRISGPGCLDVYSTLCPKASPLRPRYASLRTLYSSNSEILDSSALTLYFPSPKSATGDDVLELHIHGGSATIKAVLAAISQAQTSSASTIRYAEPGEFTRRAFYNNRLDLTQIEALGDSLAAGTEQQRRLAVQGTTSLLTSRYESWRQMLLAARGELEALIDFSEDQHFDESPIELMSNVGKQIVELDLQIRLAIINSSRGELLRNGIKVALLGAPNAGKSTLLNKIVGREAAIVSHEPGTTRDVVEVNVDIGGFFCNFGDLAGLRNTSNGKSGQHHPISKIEAEGIRRAKERVLSADVIILVVAVPIKQSKYSTQVLRVQMEDEILDVLRKCNFARQKLVCVCNKADLLADGIRTNPMLEIDKWEDRVSNELQDLLSNCYLLSCIEDEEVIGAESRQKMLDTFLDALKQTFKEMTSVLEPESMKHRLDQNFLRDSLGATERQRLLLVECRRHLKQFLALGHGSQDEEPDLALHGREAKEEEGRLPAEEVDIVVAAEHLRAAADCLGKIMGRGESGDVEEVLGVVFEKYVLLERPTTSSMH